MHLLADHQRAVAVDLHPGDGVHVALPLVSGAPLSTAAARRRPRAGERGECWPRWTRLRSAALRNWAISLSRARSKAAGLSSAAASARTTGPLVRRVISTRLAWSCWRLFRSAETSTSTRMTRSLSFSSRVIFSSTYARNCSDTLQCRALTTTSMRYLTSVRTVRSELKAGHPERKDNGAPPRLTQASRAQVWCRSAIERR